MISQVKLNLSKGYYEIIRGTDFAVISDDSNHLEFEKDSVWNVSSDPNGRHTGNTVIMIPDDVKLESFILYGNDIAVKCNHIRARKLYYDLKSLACEFSCVEGEKIGIAMGRGDARFKIKTLDILKVDCGYGTVNIDLPSMPCGYDITSQCGIGKVTLNSQKLPRTYTEPNSGKVINIVCGMGNVNINTYKK